MKIIKKFIWLLFITVALFYSIDTRAATESLEPHSFCDNEDPGDQDSFE